MNKDVEQLNRAIITIRRYCKSRNCDCGSDIDCAFNKNCPAIYPELPRDWETIDQTND